MTINANKVKQLGVDLRSEAVKLGVWPCCLNCEHWREYTEVHLGQPEKNKREMRCAKYKQIPPAETIVVGCNQHTQYIPF